MARQRSRGLAGLVLTGIGLLTGGTAAARERIELPGGWLFTLGDPGEAASIWTGADRHLGLTGPVGGVDAAEGNDPRQSWRLVTVPHTWKAADGQDGGNNYHRGPGWYRLELPELPPADAARAFLRFGAANAAARVYLDGELIGEHIGGHTAFCFEVPASLMGRPGDGRIRRTLAVRVDNTHDPDIAPFDADFTFFGGIYRPVELLLTPSVCIAPDDHASPGVRVDQNAVSSERASFTVRVLASTPEGVVSDSAAETGLRTTVFDSAGRTVSVSSSRHRLVGGLVELRHEHVVASPRLWDGLRDPHLYRVLAELTGPDGRVDRVVLSFGLRTFAVDPQRGFLLNGREYPLHGVNKHQDRLDKGWAVDRADIAEDIAIIHEMGATTIRFAHYPHDPFAYAECDRLGIVAWAEIPLVNRVTGSDAFTRNTEGMLIDMIRQLHSHASIALWGVHNEVTAPWVKEKGVDPEPLVRRLDELAKQEDPTRLTTSAGADPREHPSNWVADAPGINIYIGWYGGAPERLGARLDAIRAMRPDKPLAVTEYGAGASIVQHEFLDKGPVPGGKWHPEQWQTRVHIENYRAIAERDWLWGVYIWNMFDFAADQRSEGDHDGRNDKGLVTYDRRTRKDAFWFYKANWSEEPVLYLADRRFVERKDRLTPVRVFSNATSVELIVNGRSLGERAPELGVAMWDGVELAEGDNVVEASGMIGERQYRDRVEWSVSAEGADGG